MGHHLVTSNSRANSDIKDWLVTVLKSWGVDVWDDQGKIHVGDGPWREQIVEAISGTKILLIIWTREFAQSDVCHFEFVTALGFGKVILPLWFEDCEIPDRFGGLRHMHRVNYYNGEHHENHDELLAQFRRLGVSHSSDIKVTRTPPPPLPGGVSTSAKSTDECDPSKYLLEMRDEHSHIDIRGLQVESGRANRFSIEELYIPLTMEGGAEEESSGPIAEVNDDDESETDQRIELDQALRDRRLVIVGDPGTGKTTFLRRIAYRLSNHLLRGEANSTPPFGFDDSPLPIFIRIGELCEHIINRRLQRQGPTTENTPEWIIDFLEVVSKEQRWGLSRSYMEEQLEKGEAILLLDGLDEAPDDSVRRQVSSIVQNANKAFRDCRFVVTTRPRAYEGDVTLASFSQVQIEGLESNAVVAFLKRWCDSLFPGSPSQAARHHRELIEALRAKPEIRRIARNPVMLTALAVVHWNEKRIPEQRADLYESIIKWLSRSRERRPGRPSPEQCVNILQELAVYMQNHKDGRQIQIPHHEAAIAISGAWRKTPSNERVAEAREFLAREELDSGIIVSRGDHVRFWHLTFEEFLAARALASRPDEEQSQLLFRHPRKLFSSEWRETVLLLAGVLYHNGSAKVDRMVREILNGLVAAKNKKIKLSDAARCAGVLGGIEQDLSAFRYQPDDPRYERLLRSVMGIFDPENSQSVTLRTRIEAATALGRAGDPRFTTRSRQDNWAVYPAGQFQLATHRRVRNREFTIGRYPVTVGEFSEFVDDGGYREEHWWTAGGFGLWQRPGRWREQCSNPTRAVIRVSWFEAMAYTEWATQHMATGEPCRLPTEVEWERAAGGLDARPYPWGEEPPTELRLNAENRVGHVTPVGVFPLGANPEGVHDLSGNVWEWCLDQYARNPVGEYTPSDGGLTTKLVIRGGSWGVQTDNCLAGARFQCRASRRLNDLGFRIVRGQLDLDPPPAR